MNVLVCDDDSVVIKLVELALKDKQVNLSIARNGQEGLNLLNERNDFDLIITDLHMPVRTGDDLLRLVREEQKKDTPIIMLSSDNEEEVIALAQKMGITDYIVKPITSEKLSKKLNKYLK